MSPIGPKQWNGARPPDPPEKIHDAAQQFEALLIGQILRTAREAGGGFMGEKDASADCAIDFAEQQFATVMARSGGLGLATLIMKGLERQK